MTIEELKSLIEVRIKVLEENRTSMQDIIDPIDITVSISLYCRIKELGYVLELIARD